MLCQCLNLYLIIKGESFPRFGPFGFVRLVSSVRRAWIAIARKPIVTAIFCFRCSPLRIRMVGNMTNPSSKPFLPSARSGGLEKHETTPGTFLIYIF
jgi:hypothetical protein